MSPDLRITKKNVWFFFGSEEGSFCCVHWLSVYLAKISSVQTRKCAVGKQKPPFWHWKKSLDLALLANSLFLYYGEKVVKTSFFGIEIPTESLEKRENQYFWHYILFEDYCDWYPGDLKKKGKYYFYFFIWIVGMITMIVSKCHYAKNIFKKR